MLPCSVNKVSYRAHLYLDSLWDTVYHDFIPWLHTITWISVISWTFRDLFGPQYMGSKYFHGNKNFWTRGHDDSSSIVAHSFVNQCNSVNFSFAVLQWINMTEIEIKNPKILSILKKRLNNPVSDGTTDSLWRKNVTPSPGGISEKENNPVFHAYTTIVYFVSMSNKLSLTLHMVFIAVLINGGSATPEKNKHDVVQLYLGDKTVTSQLS